MNKQKTVEAQLNDLIGYAADHKNFFDMTQTQAKTMSDGFVKLLHGLKKTIESESVQTAALYIDQMDQPRDHSHFIKLGKQATLASLAEHEQAGTLAQYLKQVAPDYLDSNQQPMVFTLVGDLRY